MHGCGLRRRNSVLGGVGEKLSPLRVFVIFLLGWTLRAIVKEGFGSKLLGHGPFYENRKVKSYPGYPE